MKPAKYSAILLLFAGALFIYKLVTMVVESNRANKALASFVFDPAKQERHVVAPAEPMVVATIYDVRAGQPVSLRYKDVRKDGGQDFPWPVKNMRISYVAEGYLLEGEEVKLIYYIPIQKPGTNLSLDEMEQVAVRIGVISATSENIK